MKAEGFLFDVQMFSLHDGPGIRTTVFLQGCDLRCDWCHNPESQPARGAMLVYPSRCIRCGACGEICPEGDGVRSAVHTPSCRVCGACAEACFAEAVKKSGYPMDAETLAGRLLADRPIYETSGGGVTFSGGEPLLQADFVRAVMEIMKREKVHTALETCLCVNWDRVQKVLPVTDLIYADLKCVSPDRHKRRTGADNSLILDNIRRLASTGKELILRTPVVPGFNDDDGEMRRIGEFVLSLPSRPILELMAFHSLCAPKYAALGRVFPCGDTPEPGRERMEEMTRKLALMGLTVKYSL